MHCYIEPLQDEEDQILGTIGLAFDITERIQAEDSRIRMKEAETRAEVIEATNLQLLKEVSLRMQAENQLEKSLLDIQQVLQGVIQAISMTVEIRDPYTAGHQRRVSDLAYAIARQMKLSDEQADIIRMAGLLHDIGKVMVPAEILSKPGKLNLVEFSLIQMHPQVGYDILKSINFPWPIARIVHQHHEKLDGSGYPLHETKDNILLEAQILSVADMVEAIASHRPYRPSLGIETALEEIRKYQGVQLNSEAVDACITLFQEGLFAFT
ncbi:MAG: HD domain-containing protein [Candidatus Delongbacteria bacterium]|nr:HD domain-containing protein [Candidatus Delongbacteria bacterium]